ncbi:MAG: helix-turn-helix domain-containing protein [Burkholderiales bacterium]|nr:helix-turn-helix domain-containing protein [Burkholderiales bacterium]
MTVATDEPIPAPSGHALRPAGALGAFVECLWYGAAATAEERHHVVAPDGRMDVVLAFDDARGDAMVFGTTTRAIPYELVAGRRYLGIRFRPGCSRRMIEHRPLAVRDRRDPVERVAGIDAYALLDLAASARGPQQALQAVAGSLEPSVRHLDGRDDLVTALAAYVDGRHGNLKVSELAHQAGVSERQLERLFVEAVGLPPKLYARVVRYQRVRAALARGAKPGAALAQRFGYTDQSHLLRDLRSLAGFSR